MKPLVQKMLPCSEKSLMGRRERKSYFCLTQWHWGWWAGTFLPRGTRCQGWRSGLPGVNIVNKIASHSRVISVTQNNKQQSRARVFTERCLSGHTFDGHTKNNNPPRHNSSQFPLLQWDGWAVFCEKSCTDFPSVVIRSWCRPQVTPIQGWFIDISSIESPLSISHHRCSD